jgi:signal peptidase I
MAVLAAGIWLLAGPVQFGGPASYVITSGVSMLPLIHAGDLVVTRRADSYQIGEIIAYHATPRTIILHRIVGRDGARYVTKGDNNPAPDAIHPTHADVVGSLWLHLPSAGHYMALLRSPGTLAILVFISVLAGVLSQKRRATRRERRGIAMNEGYTWMTSGAPSPRDEKLALALIAVLATLALAIIAYSHPTQRPGSVDTSYRQQGTFGYTAAATGGIYNGDQVTSGQPVYLRLVRNVDVHFDYRFSTPAAHQVHGTAGLAMEIGQDSGWQRTVQLTPPAPFNGDQATVAATVDLGDVQRFIDSFSAQTGVHNTLYTLALVPQVQVQGDVADQTMSDTFAPRLQFTLDPNQLVLNRPPDSGDPLRPVQDGSVTRPASVANVFSILGLHLPVSTARLITLPAFLLAGLIAIAFAQPVLAARHEDEAAKIGARYGSMLLNVHRQTAGAPERLVELDSIDDLAKVAGKEGRMILHSNGGGPHQYVVADGETLYRYRAAPPSKDE